VGGGWGWGVSECVAGLCMRFTCLVGGRASAPLRLVEYLPQRPDGDSLCIWLFLLDPRSQAYSAAAPPSPQPSAFVASSDSLDFGGLSLSGASAAGPNPSLGGYPSGPPSTPGGAGGAGAWTAPHVGAPVAGAQPPQLAINKAGGRRWGPTVTPPPAAEPARASSATPPRHPLQPSPGGPSFPAAAPSPAGAAHYSPAPGPAQAPAPVDPEKQRLAASLFGGGGSGGGGGASPAGGVGGMRSRRGGTPAAAATGRGALASAGMQPAPDLLGDLMETAPPSNPAAVPAGAANPMDLLMDLSVGNGQASAAAQAVPAADPFAGFEGMGGGMGELAQPALPSMPSAGGPADFDFLGGPPPNFGLARQAAPPAANMGMPHLTSAMPAGSMAAMGSSAKQHQQSQQRLAAKKASDPFADLLG
jgi:AP-4 complex subunit epsilon-1